MAAKQSDLEKVGFDRRQVETTRSESVFHYSKNNQYKEGHDKATTHDDNDHPWGKGTGKSYTHTTPQSYNDDTKNSIKPQLDTTDGGGSYDKYGYPDFDSGRRYLMTISKYSASNPYYENGVVNIDTSANRDDGQYYVK